MIIKKIGIITFHRPVNVGSFMQAYSLSRFISQREHAVNVIDFYSDNQREQYSKLYLNNAARKSLKFRSFLFVYNIFLIMLHGRIKSYNKEYQDYVRDNLPLTSRTFSSGKELHDANLPYDVYISGSDQIWNTDAIDFDETYMLSFVKKGRKVAYAPSLGNSINKLTPHQLSLIKSYEKLSVREKAGAEYLSTIIGTEIPSVLDPTFLLDIDDFRNLERPSGIKGKYIFYYSIGYDIVQRKQVNEIAKGMNMKVVSWNPQQYIFDKMFIRNLYQPKVQNPGVWLDLVRNASLVISGSFHGSVFSVIYEKNFCILSKKENHRLDIFKEIGLDYTDLKGNTVRFFTKNDINRDKLQDLKDESAKFLLGSIEDV